MKHAAATAIVLVLAACSPSRDDATPANGTVAEPSSGVRAGGEADPSTPAAMSPASPAAPPPVADPPEEASDIVAETPFTPDSAQGAANVVQTYYAHLEAGEYRRAWRLWDDNGRALGVTADAFAASFGRYREYHAEVGAPGRIEAGAGQRYVTVPVKVYGRLKAGNRAFTMEGPVTLHRAGAIDGATAEQRSWRISASGVRPRPAAAEPPAPETIAARYACTDGTRFDVTFDNIAGTGTLLFRPRGEPVELRQRRTASGIRYAAGGYDLRGKGREATLERPGGETLTCTAR